MKMRTQLPMVLAVLALLASTAAFAAEAPAVAMSDDQFLATLQGQPGDAGEELSGMQTPIFKHGTNCHNIGVTCRPCTLSNGSPGRKGCTVQECTLNGTTHTHYVGCSACAPDCNI